MPRTISEDNDDGLDLGNDIMSRIDNSIASTMGDDEGGGGGDDAGETGQPTQRTQQRPGKGTDRRTEDDTGGEDDAAGVRRTIRKPGDQQQQQTRQQKPPPGNRQQQQQQQPPRPGAGDLVDGQGQVVATAGRERRYYENWQRTNHALSQANERMQTLQTEVDAHKSANAMAAQLGITPIEQTTALQFAAAWKRDPKRAITALLTTARQQGIELELEGVAPVVDIEAVTSRIMQQLAPVVQTAQQHQQQQTSRTEAQRQYNAFLSNYPDAALHQEPIANLMARRTDMSLVEAYQNLKLFALENGLDWNQPLKPQLDALRQQQQQQPNGGSQRVTPRPLTGGGRTGGRMVGGGQEQPQAPKMYPANTSWDTIAREVIAEFVGN